MTAHVAIRYPTARKRHYCGICQRVILPGETYSVRAYMDDGWAGSVKACLHCECVMGAHSVATPCWCSDEGWDGLCELEWLDDEHPEVAAALRAGWRYPDGELLPLPFQTRCACGNPLALRTRIEIAMRTVSGLCASCRMARIETQLGKLADGNQEGLQRIKEAAVMTQDARGCPLPGSQDQPEGLGGHGSERGVGAILGGTREEVAAAHDASHPTSPPITKEM